MSKFKLEFQAICVFFVAWVGAAIVSAVVSALLVWAGAFATMLAGSFILWEWQGFTPYRVAMLLEAARFLAVVLFLFGTLFTFMRTLGRYKKAKQEAK